MHVANSGEIYKWINRHKSNEEIQAEVNHHCHGNALTFKNACIVCTVDNTSLAVIFLLLTIHIGGLLEVMRLCKSFTA